MTVQLSSPLVVVYVVEPWMVLDRRMPNVIGAPDEEKSGEPVVPGTPLKLLATSPVNEAVFQSRFSKLRLAERPDSTLHRVPPAPPPA